MTTYPDHVILLDEAGNPAGTAPRATVHHEDTPLHLAFSCYLFDSAGQVLLTRRALSKRTFAGVWTNSFCGHPRPGEDRIDAVHRHADHELGITVHDVQEILPEFRYRAVDASGVVENEICPVFIARTDVPVRPNPEEVDAFAWAPAEHLSNAVRWASWALSPWSVAQVPQLQAAGALPAAA
ncbi:MAG TPA: isopentenyl-diphosphate Delta-isomerase [Beutenbergiaceae bacterium]|nr:isopentenyl-diphosphate Delta-isomerase [Beutenbergiaceae bacterium]